MQGLLSYAGEAARGPGKRRLLLIAASAVVVAGSLIGVAGPAGATGAPGAVHTQSLNRTGARHFTAGSVHRATQTRPAMSGAAAAARPRGAGYRTQDETHFTVRGHPYKKQGTLPIPTRNCAAGGCDSINTGNGGAITQRHGLAATANGNIYGFDIEPPDQALCANNQYSIEGINIGEIQVFNSHVKPVSGITSLDSLMGLTQRGWSSGGDVVCLYDPGNGGHWFIIEIVSTNTEASGGPFTGCFAGVQDACREGLAVSTTNNPLATSWNIYFLDPNTLSPNDQGAGYLLNDFAKLGNTRDALLMSYDEFILNSKYIPPCPAFGCVSFNGAQQLAIQKKALELGYNSANFVHENMGTDPFIQPPDGNCSNGPGAGVDCWGPVIPAASPDGEFNNNYGGTGFLAATLDFNSFAFGVANGDNRVAVFYWTGLKYLNSFNCNACQLISFGGQLFTGVETYIDGELGCLASSGNPACSLAQQRLGTLDLGTYCGEPVLGNPPLASVPKCPEQGLATNGDTVYEASYSDGQIWFGTHTWIKQEFASGSEIHVGGAYWVVGTSQFTGAQQLLTLTSQGYISPAHEDIEFPTVLGSPSGAGLVSFTLSGNGGPTRADNGGFFPSSAYGRITASSHGLVGHTVYIADLGLAPQDGFSEYQGLPGGIRPRWGDYGAGIFVPGKGFYFASEYIQYPNCNPAYWYNVDPTCNGTRDPFANFGTSVNLVPAS